MKAVACIPNGTLASSFIYQRISIKSVILQSNQKQRNKYLDTYIIDNAVPF